MAVKGLYDMTLEELMQVEVRIASINKSSKSIDAPGIVSIIKREEIVNSGARDLLDILRLVPGFSFAFDVEGQVGIVNRGNWAHEGKILLMIDGQVMNEHSYSTPVVGNRFPVENIQSIEIIRGPGSAIYGGYAEMGVINIITKKGKQINGISAGVTHGSTSNKFRFRENAYLTAGKEMDDFSFSLFGKIGQNYRSDRDYTDLYGSTFNMTENEINPVHLNAHLRYKNLEFRGIFDNYETDTRDFDGRNLLKAYQMDFVTYLAEIKYKLKVSDKLRILPKFNIKRDVPWYSNESPIAGETNEYYRYYRRVNQYKGSVIASYDWNENFDFAFGLETSSDYAKDLTDDVEKVFWNGEKTINYQNYAAYFQSNFTNRFFKTTIGARYDKHSQYGGAFVPRIAIMKNIKRFNLKLLYNRAFRAPGIENIDLNYYLNPQLNEPQIKPEITNVYNAEIGYQINKNIYIVTNIFRIALDNTIVYSITETGTEGYDNLGKTGSQGIELAIKTKFENVYFNCDYSFYTTKNMNEIDDYAIPDNDNLFLGAPQHKATVFTGIKISNKLNANFSMIFFSKKYGYTTYNAATDDVEIKEFPSIVLANLFISYNDLIIKGLNAGCGVYNLFNSDYQFVQPYNGWHSPVPGISREFLVKLNYNFHWKDKK